MGEGAPLFEPYRHARNVLFSGTVFCFIKVFIGLTFIPSVHVVANLKLYYTVRAFSPQARKVVTHTSLVFTVI